MTKPLDLRITDPFVVDVGRYPTRYDGQFFWPDVKPWPKGVFQKSVHGELLEEYYISSLFGEFTPIEPGALVLYPVGTSDVLPTVLTKEDREDRKKYLFVVVAK